MSSKFKELMAQARARHEELPEGRGAAAAEAEPSQSPEEADDSARAGQEAALETEGRRTEPGDGPAATGREEEQPQGAAKRGRPRGKRSHPDFEQVSAYISKSTHLSVKIALLQEGRGREFSELVEELLGQWLQK